MKVHILKILVTAGCVFLLEACVIGGDGSDSSSAVLMPLSVGNYWEYIDSSFSSSGAFVSADTSRLTIRGDTTIQYQGKNVQVFYWHWTTSPDADWLVGNEGDGLYFYGGRTSKGIFVLGKALNEKFPVDSGDHWKKPNFSVRSSDSTFYVVDTVDVRCMATDSMLATLAGVFKVYVYSYTKINGLISVATNLYYVPNKGYVGLIARTNGIITFKKMLRSYVAK